MNASETKMLARKQYFTLGSQGPRHIVNRNAANGQRLTPTTKSSNLLPPLCD